MATENLIPINMSTYWRDMATQSGRRRCIPAYIIYTLVYLVTWAFQKYSRLLGEIDFEPPETLRMGKILMFCDVFPRW